MHIQERKRKALFRRFLIDRKACSAGRAFARGKTLEEIWATCPKLSWLKWILREAGTTFDNDAQETFVFGLYNIVEYNSPRKLRNAVDLVHMAYLRQIVSIEQLQAVIYKSAF